MLILKSDDVMYYDCDDTLVLWGKKESPEDEEIVIKDVYMPNSTITLVKHQRNIDLLKRNKGQGRGIIVWSAGGVFHAEEIVKALKLENYVDLIVAKPMQYVDDLDIKDWGCKRIYLGKYMKGHPVQDDINEAE
jgi:hypothetical protein